MNTTKQKVGFIDWITKQTVSALEKEDILPVVFRDTRLPKKVFEGCEVVYVDFENKDNIKEIFTRYKEELVAITCLAEKMIDDFTRVIPLLPNLLTPSIDSLSEATSKVKTRETFQKHCPEVSFHHLLVHEATSKTLETIKKNLQFPLIIKPAHLEMSLLISVVQNEKELVAKLESTFEALDSTYKTLKRRSKPEIIVEEYGVGPMYTIAVDVMDNQACFFYPIIRVFTGRDVGFDDPFLFERTTIHSLSNKEMQDAQEAAKKAIFALGLKNTTTHIELLQTENGWKVIEIGPRIGGFREIMYKLSYNIEYGLNDVKIRMGEKPEIPQEILGYTSVFRFYAKNEGNLVSIENLDEIRRLKSFYVIKERLKTGDACLFSKNGGKGVCDITLTNENQDQFLEDKANLIELLRIVTN